MKLAPMCLGNVGGEAINPKHCTNHHSVFGSRLERQMQFSGLWKEIPELYPYTQQIPP